MAGAMADDATVPALDRRGDRQACVAKTLLEAAAIEEILRADRFGGAVEIRWNAPAGYAFTEQGIRFEGSSPVIDPKPGLQDRGARWMVVDRPNGQKATAKYRIQVRSTSGTVCTGPDPLIANE